MKTRDTVIEGNPEVWEDFSSRQSRQSAAMPSCVTDSYPRQTGDAHVTLPIKGVKERKREKERGKNDKITTK